MLLADLGADVVRIDRKHGHQAHFTETASTWRAAASVPSPWT
ncbi:MAG: hypothetical protein WC997_09520 [Porticoccaceae bacterium]